MRFRSLTALRLLLVAGILALVCLPARANMAIPTVVAVWPASWQLLIPIVLIETWVAMRVLGLPFGAGLKSVGWANIVSTLIGIPVTGIGIFLFQIAVMAVTKWQPHTLMGEFVSATVAWVEYTPYWMVPASVGVVCVPFFFMSVYVERRSMEKHLAQVDGASVRRWAWQANLLSYGLIEIGLGIATYLALRK
jgi:hypothetical protein